jgi:hypothetical protein
MSRAMGRLGLAEEIEGLVRNLLADGKEKTA